jgi:cobalt/nickel transport system permease protein
MIATTLAAWPSAPLVWAVSTGLLLIIATLSTIPPWFLIRRILTLEIVVLGMAVLLMLRPNGMETFAAVMVKSTLCIIALVLFSNTTPFSDTLSVLKRVKTPALVVTLLALMYRYLFLFVDELERMRCARASRTFVNGRTQVWKSHANIVTQLFIHSIERAERIFAAMCARGWQ